MQDFMHIWSSGVYIEGLEYNVKLKFSSSDRIKTILNTATLELISENVGNLLIYSEKF